MGTVICDNEGAIAPNLGGNTDFFVPSSVFALLGAFLPPLCKGRGTASAVEGLLDINLLRNRKLQNLTINRPPEVL